MLTILQGHALDKLAELPDESVNCCITSPPYWGLRAYGTEPQTWPDGWRGELGNESTPELYVSHLVKVFREVRRVLRKDGTLWLNLGDVYAHNGACGGGSPLSKPTDGRKGDQSPRGRKDDRIAQLKTDGTLAAGLKPKDLIGIPWRVAFGLRADGWYLRQWMPWVKRASMPESAPDRPSSACEIVFLLSRSERYHYDAEAVKLPASVWHGGGKQNPGDGDKQFGKGRGNYGLRTDNQNGDPGWRQTRNSDWFFEGLITDEQGGPLAFVVSPAAFPEAHFATFPPNLVKPCILAGCPVGGTVLDPFLGSGTTAMVALELGRKAVGIELKPEYVQMARQRCHVTPGLPLA